MKLNSSDSNSLDLNCIDFNSIDSSYSTNDDLGEKTNPLFLDVDH